jgi:aspartate kinase
MALIVQKYGGTSVGDLERIERVADRVKATRDAGNDVVVVLSAMGGETDRLLELARQVSDRPARRELDVLLATGEQVSIALLCMSLARKGCAARSFTGGQARIRTDTSHTKARIQGIDVDALRSALGESQVAVVAGFQGVDEAGNITTLGRGGSDTTAVALAAALEAEECQIYTDVDGVYTSDPRVVPDARRLETITFEEMLELASLGARVLQIRAVEFASKYKVKDEAKLTVKGVPDRPGIAAALLGPIAEANIDVATTDVTFTVHRSDYEAAFELLQRHARDMNAREVTGDDRIAKISLVGVGMRSHAGIASRMFATLAAESINIQMISTSEIKISVVVDEKYLELGVRALHAAFGLSEGPVLDEAIKS